MSERSRVTDLRPDESTVRFLNVDVELYGELYPASVTQSSFFTRTRIGEAGRPFASS